MNVLRLRSTLQTYLENIVDPDTVGSLVIGYSANPKIYYEKAPSNAEFPYVVYYLDTSFNTGDGEREDFTLHVNVYDNAESTFNLEAITGIIDGDGSKTAPTGLNRKNFYIVNKLQAKVYRQYRDTLDEEDNDQDINRRLLRYIVKAYLT